MLSSSPGRTLDGCIDPRLMKRARTDEAVPRPSPASVDDLATSAGLADTSAPLSPAFKLKAPSAASFASASASCPSASFASASAPFASASVSASAASASVSASASAASASAPSLLLSLGPSIAALVDQAARQALADVEAQVAEAEAETKLKLESGRLEVEELLKQQTHLAMTVGSLLSIKQSESKRVRDLEARHAEMKAKTEAHELLEDKVKRLNTVLDKALAVKVAAENEAKHLRQSISSLQEKHREDEEKQRGCADEQAKRDKDSIADLRLQLVKAERLNYALATEVAAELSVSNPSARPMAHRHHAAMMAHFVLFGGPTGGASSSSSAPLAPSAHAAPILLSSRPAAMSSSVLPALPAPAPVTPILPAPAAPVFSALASPVVSAPAAPAVSVPAVPMRLATAASSASGSALAFPLPPPRVTGPLFAKKASASNLSSRRQGASSRRSERVRFSEPESTVRYF